MNGETVAWIAFAVLLFSRGGGWPFRRGRGRGWDREAAPADPALRAELDELRQRVEELDRMQSRVAELEERVDFSERLLVQRSDAARVEGEGRA